MTAALCHTVRGEENAAKRQVSCAYLESNRALYSIRGDFRRLAGYANPVPTFLLGAIQGLVRRLQQIGGAGAVCRIDRDAEGGRRWRQTPSEMREVGIPNGRAHLLRALTGAFQSGLGQHHGKLLAAITTGNIRGARALRDGARDGAQHEVAGIMPMVVVEM